MSALRLRNRPTWQWVVIGIILLLLVFWLFFGTGVGSDSHGIGKIQAANADNPDVSMVLFGEGAPEAGTGVTDNAPGPDPNACIDYGECGSIFAYDPQPASDPPSDGGGGSSDPPPDDYVAPDNPGGFDINWDDCINFGIC